MSLGPDTLLWELLEQGLVEPDPLGDPLAGWTLTEFAQRRLQLIRSLTGPGSTEHPRGELPMQLAG